MREVEPDLLDRLDIPAALADKASGRLPPSMRVTISGLTS
jgi:hypothetical protein